MVKKGRGRLPTYLSFLGSAGEAQDEGCEDEVDARGGEDGDRGGREKGLRTNKVMDAIHSRDDACLAPPLPPPYPPFGRVFSVTYMFTSIDRKLDSSSTCRSFEQAPMMS